MSRISNYFNLHFFTSIASLFFLQKVAMVQYRKIPNKILHPLAIPDYLVPWRSFAVVTKLCKKSDHRTSLICIEKPAPCILEKTLHIHFDASLQRRKQNFTGCLEAIFGCLFLITQNWIYPTLSFTSYFTFISRYLCALKLGLFSEL